MASRELLVDGINIKYMNEEYLNDKIDYVSQNFFFLK